MSADAGADGQLVLQCAGSAFQGTVSVQSRDVSLRVLRDKIRQAVSEKSGETTIDVKLITSGRNLTDLDKSLKDYGVTSASRILVLKHADNAHKQAMDAASERETRIKRLRHAVDAMAGRAGSASRYSLQLENQDGAAMKLDPEQRSLIAMGLTLHESGKKLLAKGDWAGALNEFELAEESFDLCDSDLLGSVDNVGLLLLDSVWCLFKLQDSGRLAAARAKLRRARTCLAASHGAHLERLRVLHGNFQPELAIYVRLELLEGVSSYYGGGDAAAARERLLSAQAKWRRLAVADDALASLVGMGFTSSEASRALRFCSGDVGQAAAFVLQQRQVAAERKAADRRKRAARKEVEALGRTAGSNETVDVDALERLHALGFDRGLAAQALLQADNRQDAALNSLLDPEHNTALQLAAADAASRVESKAAAERQLRSMGYAKWYVREALKHCGVGDIAAAVAILSSWAAQDPSVRQEQNPGDAAARPAAGSAPAEADTAAAAPGGIQAGASAAAAQLAAAMSSAAATMPPLPKRSEDTADQEMEAEVASLMHRDSLSGYDVDVSEEGNIIREFLARLEAFSQSCRPSAGV